MEKRTSAIFPRIQAKLEKAKEAAALCNSIPSSPTAFQWHVSSYVTSMLRSMSLSGIGKIHTLRHMATPYLHVERHWTKVDYPLQPPPIKIGPGRPRKNRIKDPHEDPKKPGKLTRHGVEMHCSVCKGKGHNKRRCPNKDSAAAAANKRQRVEQASTSASTHLEIASGHASNISAQPSRTGRNGRTIAGGRGSRGTGVGRGIRGAGRSSTVTGRGSRGGGDGRGSRGAGRGRGSKGRGGSNGGRGNVPAGVGVFVGNDGSTYFNGRMQAQGSQLALGLGSQASTSTTNHPSVHGSV
ncbi:uncharacterized protein LOC104905154 [Beta vulgaris subsp. vulgaris]|uniref:uncharacterized protein LOC104905154 n=1 Tax=Beta vulgaris subsp. vulgaris TaxID=3555 RepID=UPI00053FAE4B|nr:uncharacterized protein LOC104905154 [Beta vulgaris subsp. vulgaris]